MPSPARNLSPIAGFLVGLLVVVVPMAIYVASRASKDRAASPRPVASRAADRDAPAPAPALSRSSAWSIDATSMTRSGASLAAAVPLPPPPETAACLRRVETWLRLHEIDPYSGTAVDSLRLFALEVECWHRLAAAAAGTGRQETLRSEVRRRLERFAGGPLRDRLTTTSSGAGLLEALILIKRAIAYDVDATQATAAVQAVMPILAGLMERLPPATAALYAAHLGSLKVPGAQTGARILASPALVLRPREAASRMEEVGALTQEILARTDLAQRPLEGIDPPSRAYLERALPHFALAAVLLQNLEQAADLASCLSVSGLTMTHGYHEVIRFLVANQSANGSFGPASVSVRGARMAYTSSCVAALSLIPRAGTAG